MRKLAVSLLLAVCFALQAGTTIAPAGQVSNDTIYLSATLLSSQDVNALFQHDFLDRYTVIEVKLTPKSGKLAVKLDDFLLRTDKDGEKSGPFPVSMVYGEGALIINRNPDADQNRNNQQGRTGLQLPLGIRLKKKKTDAPPPEPPPPPKQEEAPTPELKALLKAKMLPEKTTGDAVEGLLFFPLEKQKVKDLELLYTTPAGKLRLRFK